MFVYGAVRKVEDQGGGVTRVVRAGDTHYRKPGVMHGCRCLKPGVLLDTFTPQRSDFLPA